MAEMSRPRVDIIDPFTAPELATWLENAKQTTIFHSTSWARVIAESYDYQPVFLALSQHGNLKACLPVMEVDSPFTGKRGVCLSFSDYCGAIAEDSEEFRLLFDAVRDYGRVRKWRYIEFRGEPYLGNEKPFKSYAHHLIELSGDERLMLSRLRKSTVRGIQKAVREGVTVDVSETLGGVLDYYHLHCLTRRRQGLPPQPRSYFLKLHEHVIAEKLGFTALARQGDGAPMAGIICLRFGKNAIYKYGASITEFQHLRANNLLFWETISKCGRDGYDYLSLGRTDLDNEGLLVFKDGWGGRRTCLNYYRYDLAAERFISECPRELAGYRWVLQKMPVGVLRMLGRIAYRHLG